MLTYADVCLDPVRFIIFHPSHQHFTPTFQRLMSQDLIDFITRIMITRMSGKQNTQHTVDMICVKDHPSTDVCHTHTRHKILFPLIVENPLKS